MAAVQPRTPTHVTYAELQAAFDHFNAMLFDLRLPYCLITLQREKRTFGYFSNERFAMAGGTKVTDEIAMNPSYFVTRSIKETLSTLVHEMVHQWQHHFGESGRRGYHNKQWADKMEQLGLMPTSTGAPGGRKVGDMVSHYIIEAGRFDKAATKLLTKKFRLSWVDRFPPDKPHKSASSALSNAARHGERSEGA